MRSTITPQDILADGVDYAVLNETIVRKGTVAAFLANISIFENGNISEAEREAALKSIKELAPAVVATGLHRHVVFKNNEIEKILSEVTASSHETS